MIDSSMIRKLNIELTPEQAEMEEKFIESAVNETDEHISEYIGLASSMNGRYICSDLFKETFEEYRKSLDNRKQYASVVHNSAAVLSNELFQRVVKAQNINSCIFLTGVPGAGKSFLIQSLNLGGLIPNDVMIFEGDISSQSIIDKMKLVVENGKTINIMVVNPTLELAMNNAINRSFEIGRGASCHTMARIISALPDSIRNIFKLFGDKVSLGIYDKKTNFDIMDYYGLENINLLEHGNYDEVRAKLEDLRIRILKSKENNDELIETINAKC